MERSAKNPVHSLTKAFEILEVLVELDGAGVTEVAGALNEPKSTIHNYLSTLLQEEYVVNEDGQYHLGLRFLELGIHARNRHELFTVGKSEAQRLARETGEFSNIAVEEYGHCITIYRNQGEMAVNSRHVGMRSSLHATAVGRAMLAHMPEDRVETVIEQQGLQQFTERTIDNRDDLYDELETIQNRGYAFDDEELLQGLRCVAAPVLTTSGGIIGAISVSGPTTRLSGEYYHEDLPKKVMEASNVISLNIEAN